MIAVYRASSSFQTSCGVGPTSQTAAKLRHRYDALGLISLRATGRLTTAWIGTPETNPLREQVLRPGLDSSRINHPADASCFTASASEFLSPLDRLRLFARYGAVRPESSMPVHSPPLTFSVDIRVDMKKGGPLGPA